MQQKVKVLVVDDEAIMRESLRDWLIDAGYDVSAAESGIEALEIIRNEKPDVAVIDLVLPGMDGLELFREARRIQPDIQVIIITAFSSVNTAVTAIKEGAFDYLEKPFPPDKVELLITRMMERKVLLKAAPNLPSTSEEKLIFENIVAKSSRMQKIIDIIKVVARSNAPVLISGESGTGKETIARAIHSQSQRKNQHFIVVSCARLPEAMIESDLFGQEMTAISGSQIQRKGKLETASQGTLFLDEVGDLDPNVQVNLLRSLEEKVFYRLGGSEPLHIEVRLISATSLDLKKSIESGHFREELYYRLGVVNIELPPLRERKEDIPVLAEFFLKRFKEDDQKKVIGFSTEASDFLLKYEWPGNIRELENAVERAVILAKGEYIQVTDISQQSLYLAHKMPTGKTMREIEKNHIIQVLTEAGGNCSEAARLLGISRMTLYNKIKAYGLNISKLGNGN
jgi:two-component system, NtrC family, response regulator AtoC